MLRDLYSADYLDTQQEGDFGPVASRHGLAFTVSSVAAVCGLVGTLSLIVVTDYSRHLTAQGEIVPATGLATVVAPATGTVTAAFLRDGSRVKAGEKILSIDVGTHSRSGRVSALVEAQLRAEKTLLAQERELRLRQYNIERASLLDQHAVLNQELTNERGAGARQDQTLSAMRAELQVLARERRAGLSTNQQVQYQLYSVSQASVARSQLLQSEAATLGQKLSVEQKLNDEPASLATDLAKISADIADLDEKIVSNEPRDTVDAVASTAGIVSALTVHVGESVKEAEQLAVVLPDTRNLVAEVYVDDAGAGHLKKGARAELELAAFPVQRYGVIHGHVVAISEAPESQVTAERMTHAGEERSSSQQPSETPHSRYRVWIAIDAQDVHNRGQAYRIPAGSRVTAHLAVETRPLLQWLLDPLRGMKSAADDFSIGGKTS
ncbi:HlyD family efflux transporter periplasmic adaptor subunit [Gluconacetobacter azotocaptans]|uniref:HlyD family efflux transporter periplasmic adaptor subunit n=1 Tax=Gluconacetobacter azotocaptans TaxID=142834 RepID=UPI00195D025A|nr:HlyD family efflux transporter periplasmic adaptor subunit [Gluconacetobacter azotocaptans]MBM9400828.1 HlyD family efflux transporter periplasmic adaptor subunit [Gluconacetobacter azotocaptans]